MPEITMLLILYALIFGSFVGNLVTLRKETKRLKGLGKTPLTWKNLSTIVFAFLAEVGTVTLGYYLAVAHTQWVFSSEVYSLLLFIGLYLAKELVAYLTAYALWALYVRVDKVKAEKEVKDVNETK